MRNAEPRTEARWREVRRLISVSALVVLVLVVAGSVIYTSCVQMPAVVTIEVNGETVVLKPGDNVAPEIYELAKENPEFVANSEWRLIEGRWEPLAKGVSTPLEARQLILPEGHPEFPAETTWVIVQEAKLPIEVPLPLRFPESWAGKYEVCVEDSSAYFDYSANPEQKEKLFSITALTEAQWQATEGEPRGEPFFAYSGVVFVYNPALENLYGGSYAEEFQQMVGEAYDIARSLVAFFAPAVPAEAEQALAAARLTVSEAFEIDPWQISLQVIEAKDWSNSCLGLAGPDEACAEVVTPGWRMVVSAGEQLVEVHTGETGANLRWR